MSRNVSLFTRDFGSFGAGVSACRRDEKVSDSLQSFAERSSKVLHILDKYLATAADYHLWLFCSLSLLGVQVPTCYVSVSTPVAPSFSTLISNVIVGKGTFCAFFPRNGCFSSSVKCINIAKGISVTASPAVLFNELAIVANLLDDDGRISDSLLLWLGIHCSYV